MAKRDQLRRLYGCVHEGDLRNYVSLALYCSTSGVPGERQANTGALVHAAGVNRKVQLRLTVPVGTVRKYTLFNGTPAPAI